MTLEALTSLAFAIAPELRGELYLVHRPSMPVSQCAAAFAMPRVPQSVRDELIAAGEWQGQGALIGFVDDPSPGILIHELAHVLPRMEQRPDIELSAPARKLQTLNLSTEIATDGPPWLHGGDHGAAFIRRVLHLWHRAAQAGVSIALDDCCIAGVTYGLRHPIAYGIALGDEPERCQAMTFAEIEATDPPKRFTDLWSEETSAHE
jgi:hypothetical protein